MKISKEELLKKIRKDLPTKTEEPEICETLEAPPLKEINYIKDYSKIRDKFFDWLLYVRITGSKFKSHTLTYNKIYRILPFISYKNMVPFLTLEIIYDEDPNMNSIGELITLSSNEIVDLVGEEYF